MAILGDKLWSNSWSDSWEQGTPPVVLDDASRVMPMWVVGASRSGKSTLLENMAIQSMWDMQGVTYIDPYGSSIDVLLRQVPDHRIDDTILFNPLDSSPVGFNPLKEVDPQRHAQVASEMVSVFSAAYGSGLMHRAQSLLKMSIAALLTYPDANFLHVEKLLTEPSFRDKLVPLIRDRLTKKFWTTTFPSWNPRYRDDAIEPVLNKLRSFLSPLVIDVLCQQARLDMRKVILEKKILLCNLSAGELGDTESRMLGSLLFGKLYWTAMSLRQANPLHYLYYDEAHAANLLMASALAQAPKFKLSLCLANQYATQYDRQILDALKANASHKIVFRVSTDDAEMLAKEFPEHVTADDLIKLPNYQCYAKLMQGEQRFYKLQAMEPFAGTWSKTPERVVRESRTRYGRSRDAIASYINRITQPC